MKGSVGGLPEGAAAGVRGRAERDGRGRVAVLPEGATAGVRGRSPDHHHTRAEA